MRFNGPDYDRARDDDRLSGQLVRVKTFMSDGGWHTLGQIAAATGDPESSISAQLRHLRKPRFGSHTVDKRYVGDGLFEYRLELNPGPVAVGGDDGGDGGGGDGQLQIGDAA